VADFEELFDMKLIQKKLIDASLFLMAYEPLKASIVDGVKDFFIDGINKEGFTYSDSYRSKVLPRANHVFEASLIWLLEVDAISEDDKLKIQELRDYRNSIAHDIPTTIYDPSQSIDLTKLELAGLYLNKIDNFWVRWRSIPILT
jgi:hypothetical protein